MSFNKNEDNEIARSMRSEKNQPAAILIFKIIISVLFISIFIMLFNPYFDAYKISKCVEAFIIAFFIIIIFMKMKVTVGQEPKNKTQPAEGNHSRGTAIFVITSFILIVLVGFPFLIYKSDKLSQENERTKYQTLAINAMQEECLKNCATHKVTQSSLVGPQLEHEWSHSRMSNLDYIFSWHSKNSPLILKEHIFNDHGDTKIVPQWFGLAAFSNDANPESAQDATKAIRNDMESVIQQNQTDIAAAYHHALKGSPSMHGSYIEFYLRIVPNGQVTNSNILSTDINSNELKAQLLKIFSNLHFSSGNFQTIDFTYRLHLQPIKPQ